VHARIVTKYWQANGSAWARPTGVVRSTKAVCFDPNDALSVVCCEVQLNFLTTTTIEIMNCYCDLGRKVPTFKEVLSYSKLGNTYFVRRLYSHWPCSKGRDIMQEGSLGGTE
jgi:hypothetical protein